MDEKNEFLILEALKKETSLKTVNNYGENLLHIAASNGCLKILKEVLKKENCNIDHRNVFGWTPLMQAIRNGKIDCVKQLLANGAKVTNSTFLGMSAIGLATAIGRETFEIIYEASPSALEIATKDEVCPLSIAAMKNDKELFFRLLELGLDVSKANNFAQLMMKSSLISDISNLAKPPDDVESFWHDCSDNIEIVDEFVNKNDVKGLNMKNHPNLPKICIEDCDFELSKQKNNKHSELEIIIPSGESNDEYKSLLSPNLTYNFDGAFPPSPKPIFHEKEEKTVIENKRTLTETCIEKNWNVSKIEEFDRPLQRCQDIRPPDLELMNDSVDLDNTLSFIPEYSPTKSPNVPPEIEDEDAVFGEITPTQLQETTPPAAFILTPRDAPMAFFLHSYGLGRFISIFLEQEVDVELFLTLSNEDLKEIGIESEMERRIILLVIDDLQKSELIANSKKLYDRCL